MHSHSSNNSSSQKSLNRAVQDSQITKTYLENATNRLISYMDELIEDSDPKRQYEKIVANRIREEKEMKDQNRKLLEQNKALSQELAKIKDQLRQIKASNNQGQFPQQMQFEPKSGQKNQAYQESEFNLTQLLPEQKRQQFDELQEMIEIARHQNEQDDKTMKKFKEYLEAVFERLDRMIDLSKLNAELRQDENMSTVTISREKYNKLLNYFIQGSSYIANQNQLQKGAQEMEQQQVNQFDPNNQDQSAQKTHQSELLDTAQLQKLFAKLAHKTGLRTQWEFYLTKRQGQAEKRLAQFTDIAQGRANNKDQKLLEENSKFIKEKQNLPADSVEMSTALDIICSKQKDIQDVLFDKIKNLLNKLQFTNTEIELFNRFDSKRKCDRVFDVDEFINKFKSKQDLYEISKEYTNYLMKTLNLLMVKVMETFAESLVGYNKATPYAFPWFQRKLDLKSNEVKERIFQTIEKQFSQYLKDKYPPKKSDHLLKQRKEIRKIETPQFDKEKQLQSELINVVHEYKALLNSSVLHCNKEIKVVF